MDGACRAGKDHGAGCGHQARVGLDPLEHSAKTFCFRGERGFRTAHRADAGCPVNLPSIRRADSSRKSLDRGGNLGSKPEPIIPGKRLDRNKQLGTTPAQCATKRGAPEAATPPDPGDGHCWTAGRVGLELTTYSGLPITMPIVIARYSAMTPSAARIVPEKNAT